MSLNCCMSHWSQLGLLLCALGIVFAKGGWCKSRVVRDFDLHGPFSTMWLYGPEYSGTDREGFLRVFELAYCYYGGVLLLSVFLSCSCFTLRYLQIHQMLMPCLFLCAVIPHSCIFARHAKYVFSILNARNNSRRVH